MNKELGTQGIKSTALCPAFVDTPMTDFVKGQVKAEDMIRPEDIAESVRYLLRTSPGVRRSGDHVRSARRRALANSGNALAIPETAPARPYRQLPDATEPRAAGRLLPELSLARIGPRA